MSVQFIDQFHIADSFVQSDYFSWIHFPFPLRTGSSYDDICGHVTIW